MQFVPFREFSLNPMLLAKETLQEVPTQLLNYFRTQGIVPNNLSEEQKKMIQNQLSMQKSLRSAVDPSHIEPIDDFFAAKKEGFL